MLAWTFPLLVQVLVDHPRLICSLVVVLKLWLDHVDARRKSFQVYFNVELDPDTLDASMALRGCFSLSSTAHSRPASPAWVRLGSLLSRGSVPAFPSSWAKHVRTDFWLHDICSDCFLLLHAAHN